MNRLAIYLRLSLEDKSDGFEGSIANQRKQILDYIHNDSELAKYEVMEFCDDGFSGTNMERPGVQKMLEEVRRGNVGCIIVKDMSRFSRDYIEMGTYLNRIFPFMGIRFISLNDHYDSRGDYGSTIEIDTAFRTILYDLYSKDVSVKVKASFGSKCANGEYVFGQVPFGYEKSREVKNAVIVNEEEAEIVRHIFSLAIQGESSSRIAGRLHREGIPTIMQMRRPDKIYTDGRVRSWSVNAVRNILNNRFYLGEMAYGKSVRKSVGSKCRSAVPKEDWKVIPHHHEALVTEEIFWQASVLMRQRLQKRKDSAHKDGEKHPLAGKLFCGGCGYSMAYRPLRGRNKYRRFECRNHALLQIPDCCTYMGAGQLEEKLIQMLIMELKLRGNAIRQKENLYSFQKTFIAGLKKELVEYSQEKKQVLAQKDALYEEYALMELSLLEYQRKAEELTERLSSLSVSELEIAEKLSELERVCRKQGGDIKQIMEFCHISELTKELAGAFIKKVYVYKGKRVEIEWDFSMD